MSVQDLGASSITFRRPFIYVMKSTAAPSRTAGIVFQNDFVFVQKVADTVGFRPVFIRACLFAAGD